MKSMMTDRDLPLVFISRNPYVRLLSGYIEKHAKGEDRIYEGNDEQILSQGSRLRESNPTFDGFVRKLHQLY